MKRILFFILAVAAFFSLASCARPIRDLDSNETHKEREETTPPTSTVESPEVQQEALAFTLAGYTTGGKKKWEVAADSASVFATNVVKLASVRARAWMEDNCVMLTSDAGRFDKATKNAHFEQNVEVTTQDGARLTTDYLDWEAESQIIRTDSFARVEKDNLTSTGKGMLGQPRLSKVRMNEDVTVEVRADENPMEAPTVITCDGPLEVDYENGIAYFNENVIVTDKRGKILADEMEVYIDKATKEISKVICIGDVQIQRDKNQTFSQKAVYLANEGKVILTGNPKLIIYPE